MDAGFLENLPYYTKAISPSYSHLLIKTGTKPSESSDPARFVSNCNCRKRPVLTVVIKTSSSSLSGWNPISRNAVIATSSFMVFYLKETQYNYIISYNKKHVNQNQKTSLILNKKYKFLRILKIARIPRILHLQPQLFHRLLLLPTQIRGRFNNHLNQMITSPPPIKFNNPPIAQFKNCSRLSAFRYF